MHYFELEIAFLEKKQLCSIEQHIAAYSNSDIFFTFKMKCFSFDQDATASTSNYSKPLTVPKFREFVLWVEHKLGNVMIFVILAFFVRELPSSTCHCCCNDFSFVLFRFWDLLKLWDFTECIVAWSRFYILAIKINKSYIFFKHVPNVIKLILNK